MELVRGQVGDRPWGATIATLWRRRLTGQLTLALGTERFHIAVRDGAIVGASSPLAADSAARLAVDAGTAGASQLEALLALGGADDIEAVATYMKLSPDRAIAFRRHVIAKRAARTFAFEVGEFVVEDAITIPHAPHPIDTRSVIYMGARDMMATERVTAELRRLGHRFRLTDAANLPQFGITGAPIEKLRRGFVIEDLPSHIERAMAYALACTRDCIPEGEAPADLPPRRPPTATGTMASMRTGMPYAKRDSTPPENIPKRTQTPPLGVPIMSTSSSSSSSTRIPVTVPPKEHSTDRIPVKSTAKITPPYGVRVVQAPVDVPKTEEAQAAYCRGEMALGTGQHEAAITELARATELEPNRAEYLATLAWAKFCASPNKQAIAEQTRRALTEATTKTPNPVVPLYYLACVARDLDREREALRLFQRVLHLDPEHREARREILALMQRAGKKGLLDRLRR